MNALRKLSPEAFEELLFERLKVTSWDTPLADPKNPASWELVRVGGEIRAFIIGRKEGKPVARFFRFKSDNDDDADAICARAASAPERAKCIDQDEAFDRMMRERALANAKSATKAIVPGKIVEQLSGSAAKIKQR